MGGYHRDEDGEPLAGSQVFIYQQHSTSLQITDAPTSATIYTHDSDHPTLSAATTTLPLTTANDGSWGLFTANAMRVDIKIVTTGKEDTWYYGQDIAQNPSASITVEDEGSAVTQRTTHNYTGAGVSVADTGGKTTITIPGASATPLADAAPPAIAAAASVGVSTDAAREDHTHSGSAYQALSAYTATGTILVGTGAGTSAERVPAEVSVATSQTTTSTTYTDLTTVGPAVTATTGAKALVFFGVLMSNSAGGASRMAVAVSGATTLAAADADCSETESATALTVSRVKLITGLTPGSNTFTAKYRVSSGTGTYTRRWLVVIPL